MASGAQGIGQLGSALSQATSTLLTLEQQKRRDEKQQASIDAANGIVIKAIDRRDKLEAANKSPFIIERDINRFLAEQATSTGLPINAVTSTYKNYFSGTSSDVSKPIRQDRIGDEGINYTLADGTQNFVPFSEDAITALQMRDANKAIGSNINTLMKDTGLMFKVSPQELVSLQNNPAQALNNPYIAEFVNLESRNAYLKQKYDSYATQEKVDIFKSMEIMKEADVPKSLIEIANRFTERSEYGDLTPEQVDALFMKQVNGIRNEDSKAFDRLAGDLVTNLRDIIKNMHPNTVLKGRAGKMKDIQSYKESEIAIANAKAEAIMLSKDPKMAFTKVATNMLRSLDWDVLSKLAFGTNKEASEFISTIGRTLNSVGDTEAAKIINFTQANAKQNLTKITDESLTEVEGELPESGQYMLSTVMAAANPDIGSIGVIELEYSIRTIKSDAALQSKWINNLNNYISKLDARKDTKKIQIVQNFLNQIKD